MAIPSNCPGSMTFKSPTPETFKCAKCGAEVEIWTHEYKGKCDSCGEIAYREKTPGCISWCSYAKECIGETVYRKWQEEKEEAEAHLKKLKQ